MIGFHPYPRSTSGLSRPRAKQFPWHASWLSHEISPRTCKVDYERFKPNNNGHHSSCCCYRGGWQQSCPALIPKALYTSEKQMQCTRTRDPLVAISRIAKVSRLLRPVGPGSVSQDPSPGYRSHGPYRSWAW